MTDIRFSGEDQIRFAGLSGDWNPLHVDPVAARRTMLGRNVVHGIHLVLRGLEEAGADGPLPPYRQVAVRFAKPHFVDETSRLSVEHRADRLVLAYAIGPTRIAQITLSDPAPTRPEPLPPGPRPDWDRVPRVLAIAAMEGASGHLPLADSLPDLQAAFPRTVEALGPRLVAGLMRLTRIVGMECPGLDSIFSGLNVRLADGPDAVGYVAARVNPKISYVRLDITGALEGTVDAFVRPPVLPGRVEVSAAFQPRPGEFAGRRALVVGGSRGLGRTTALLMAHGGAEVAVTYRVGRGEAEEVVDAIRAAGGTARALPFDIADPDPAALAALEPTDLFYFATPPIFVRKTRDFEPELYTGFLHAYTTAFLATVEACRSAEPLGVFYPSSVAVDEALPELAEYAAAKAAGEELCRRMMLADPRLSILVRRLPRLPTDQTATLVAVAAGDPDETMLEICRAMKPSDTENVVADADGSTHGPRDVTMNTDRGRATKNDVVTDDPAG